MITFDPDALSARKAELEAETVQPGFWDDQRRAARSRPSWPRTQRNLDMFERLQAEAGELDGMLEMAADDPEWKAELERSLGTLDARGGPAPGGGAVHRRVRRRARPSSACTRAPAAPTARTGPRCCCACTCAGRSARGFKTELLEATPGEEAGLKSATFTLTGDNAYGIMQAEKGVHRLVRLSPFDSAHRRHTSFAQVEVSPLVDDDVDVEIDEADLRIDTYRSQGAGGQHVNKTDSAVRLTHLPTGIVVQCQNERSQLQNKAQAMRILKSRLLEREHEEREAALAKERGEAQDISFGSQIRSYVLHPYTMVQRPPHEREDRQRPGSAGRRPRRADPRLAAAPRGRCAERRSDPFWCGQDARMDLANAGNARPTVCTCPAAPVP